MNNLRRAAALLCAGAALLMLALVGLPQRRDYSGQMVGGLWVAPELGALAPPLRGITLDGQSVVLPSLARPQILNFWATWCIPCEVEMPELQAVHEQGWAEVIAINQGEAQAHVMSWLNTRAIRLPVLVDEGQISAQYRINGLPTTFIVGVDGRISHVFYGPTSAAALRAAVEEAHQPPP